ncbi:MAG: glycosyltransferase [Chloroflexota bacterium]|nr:MAG: glycosyltransferase [Chloroflexota bacterium]
MLQLVDVAQRSLDSFIPVVGEAVVDELRRLAEPLRGARVAQINATPYGGGVSELLRSIVPLERDLGLATDWSIITGGEPFFAVTKALHNALQGAKFALTPDVRETYLNQSMRNAQLLDMPYDFIIVHDPQPAALPELHGRGSARWIWRCHIDTANPDPDAWDFLRPFLAAYDAAVFTMQEFAPRDLPMPRTVCIPPAIDPLSPKNAYLPPDMCQLALSWIGLDVNKPIITQVSRFDSWKDPLGVIEAYKLVRRHVPDLQLALFGAMALDDPEGWQIYRQVMDQKGDDPLIHVHTNLTGVGNFEINALQRTSRVVVQKSIREGFGLVVSEALWKSTPVVASNVGGIPLQAPPGIGGFLVTTVDEAVEKILYLLTNPSEAASLAALGKEHIKENFLITRLLADELRLLKSVAG